jgi:hypothetical protein
VVLRLEHNAVCTLANLLDKFEARATLFLLFFELLGELSRLGLLLRRHNGLSLLRHVLLVVDQRKFGLAGTVTVGAIAVVSTGHDAACVLALVDSVKVSLIERLHVK